MSGFHPVTWVYAGWITIPPNSNRIYALSDEIEKLCASTFSPAGIAPPGVAVAAGAGAPLVGACFFSWFRCRLFQNRPGSWGHRRICSKTHPKRLRGTLSADFGMSADA